MHRFFFLLKSIWKGFVSDVDEDDDEDEKSVDGTRTHINESDVKFCKQLAGW